MGVQVVGSELNNLQAWHYGSRESLPYDPVDTDRRLEERLGESKAKQHKKSEEKMQVIYPAW